MKTLSSKSNCRRQAKKELGGDAVEGLDFKIGGEEGKWYWFIPTKPKEPGIEPEEKVNDMPVAKENTMKCEHCDGTGHVKVTIGRLVKNRRHAINMKVDALAAELGVTKGSVYNIEADRTNFSIKTLTKLAGVLQCSVTDLIPSEE